MSRKMYVDVFPEDIFKGATGTMCAKFDRLVFTLSHESADVRVEPIEPDEVAQRMVFSLQHEYSGFMADYLKYRFAFPRERNDFLENTEQLHSSLLQQAVSGKPAHAVYHPYPVGISAVCDAIEPLLCV